MLINKLENKKVYAVFHNDLDGVMSRVIYEYFCKRKTENSIIVNTNNNLEHVQKDICFDYDVIIFCDITPDVEFAKDLIDRNIEIIICDHHIESFTKLKDIVKEENYYFDNLKCGAKIIFDLVKSVDTKAIIHDVVNLTNIYDMWDYKNDLFSDAVGLHACLMESIPWGQVMYKHIEPTSYVNYFVRDILSRFIYFEKFCFIEKDKNKIENFKSKINKIYKKSKNNLKKRVDNSGNNYIYYEAQSKFSFVSHRFLNEYDVDYVIARSVFDKSSSKLSLRSQKIDVGKIASLHGGGGHKFASGITFTDTELFNDICNGEKHLI